MRVADGDRTDTAQRANRPDQVVIYIGDHVPEHVSRRISDQQGALADRGWRVGTDPCDSGPFLFDPATVTSGAQLGQRAPLLPVPVDVLTLVLADRAVVAGGAVLDAAGPADGEITAHAPALSQTSFCRRRMRWSLS